jgi:hypothetical protein
MYKTSKMSSDIDIKKELEKLKIGYLKSIKELQKMCDHEWVEQGREDFKYGGIQFYQCKICESQKTESY